MKHAISPAVAGGDEAFLTFAGACQSVVSRGGDVQADIAALAAGFAARWRMPDARYLQLQPGADYASYLLYLSPRADLCIVLDIFMAGQAAVAHNHRCWGVFTCLEGSELERLYSVPADLSEPPREREARLRPPGVVSLASPEVHAFHQVECAEDERSISLHIYGADIGRIRRERWLEAERRYSPFSGSYSNEMLELPVYLASRDLPQVP